MKRFRITFKAKDGSVQRVTLLAADRSEAEKLAQQYQYRREERFPLTFARLEQAQETGKPGQIAVDPRFTGKALTEAWVKAEVERRKRDQDRYDGAGLKLDSIEEVK